MIKTPETQQKIVKQTGPKTIEGKLRSIIKRKLVTSGKFLKYKRKCDTCMLKPIVIGDSKVYKCGHYKEGQDCILEIKTWASKLEAYFMAEELGTQEIMKLVAAESFICSQEAKIAEKATKGMPHWATNEFLKTTADTLNKVEQAGIEREKLAKPQINQHLHMGEGDFVGQMLDALRKKKVESDKKNEEVIDAEPVNNEPAE